MTAGKKKKVRHMKLAQGGREKKKTKILSNPEGKRDSSHD